MVLDPVVCELDLTFDTLDGLAVVCEAFLKFVEAPKQWCHVSFRRIPVIVGFPVMANIPEMRQQFNSDSLNELVEFFVSKELSDTVIVVLYANVTTLLFSLAILILKLRYP